MKRCICLTVSLLMLFLSAIAEADGVNLPAGLPVVEEETFAMDPAIKSVTIDEGTAVIGPRKQNQSKNPSGVCDNPDG